MKTPELEKAEIDLKETEHKIHKLKTTFKDVEDEISRLISAEAALVENIGYLKASGAAVMATEYRKAKEDLIRVRGRLGVIKIDKDNIARALTNGAAYLEKAKDALTKAIIGKNNVLSFKRKKDGS